jgi:ribosomal-protein-alanine N-acetyltransferase
MKGTRVFLRSPTADDLEEFTALNQASVRLHKGWINPPIRPKQFQVYLERCQSRSYEGLLVCRKEDDAIVGAINLSEIVWGNFESAYLGYHVGALFAEQGYMTEGLQLSLRHAFQKLKLHRLEANIQPDNTASLALVRKLGFQREGCSPRYLKISGRWRDHERWAILREDWKARP